MFAEAEGAFVQVGDGIGKVAALNHKPSTVSLGLLQIHRPIHHPVNPTQQLWRQLVHLFDKGAAVPVLLLRRNKSGRQDRLLGVDEEKGQDLAISGFCPVVETEGLDLVLKDVGEYQTAVLFGDDPVQALSQEVMIPDTVEVFCATVVRLFVRGFLDLDPEFEARVGDVLDIIVVDARRDNVFRLSCPRHARHHHHIFDYWESVRCWPA